jgi:hypothetical protein
MTSQSDSKTREELRYKLKAVFGEELQMLSTELKEILIDDLVTAFENRLKVLSRAQSNLGFEGVESVLCETFQT